MAAAAMTPRTGRRSGPTMAASTRSPTGIQPDERCTDAGSAAPALTGRIVAHTRPGGTGRPARPAIGLATAPAEPAPDSPPRAGHCALPRSAGGGYRGPAHDRARRQRRAPSAGPGRPAVIRPGPAFGAFPTIEIDDGRVQLVVCPALGARVLRLVDLWTGRDWLVAGDPPAAGPDGAPLAWGADGRGLRRRRRIRLGRVPADRRALPGPRRSRGAGAARPWRPVGPSGRGGGCRRGGHRHVARPRSPVHVPAPDPTRRAARRGRVRAHQPWSGAAARPVVDAPAARARPRGADRGRGPRHRARDPGDRAAARPGAGSGRLAGDARRRRPADRPRPRRRAGRRYGGEALRRVGPLRRLGLLGRGGPAGRRGRAPAGRIAPRAQLVCADRAEPRDLARRRRLAGGAGRPAGPARARTDDVAGR